MKARIWITAAVLLVLLSAMLNLFIACRSDEEEEGGRDHDLRASR